MRPECFARKVLIVEDDEAGRTHLVETLKREGVAPIEAADGMTGLLLFREEKPDLVILDARLPVLDGNEVLRRIKSGPISRRTPVIFLTEHDEEPQATRSRAVGADFYLAKPYNLANLLSIIERSLTGSTE